MHQKLRRIALHHQGLTTARPFGKGSQAAQKVLEHLGYIQIDSLSVIERAHHHTLWTRIPDYQPEYLQQLIRERSAFEYWSHAASYLPMSSYRFVLPQMSAIRRGESPYYIADTKYIKHVIDRIRCDGPLKARDFESAKKGNAKWWNWKPAKRALEKLFMQGDLMISDRVGMEKIYDLTERVLPDETDTREPSWLELSEYLVNVSLSAHGFTTIKQLTHLRREEQLRKALKIVLRQRIEQGKLVECTVEGMPTLYTTQDILSSKIKKPTANVRLLSPFDNAIIHRDRVQQLFDFEYRLECYTPKEKRQFGYFSLPVLFKDRLVGRVDCKAHRKDGNFELSNFYLERKNIDLDEFLPCLTKVVRRFAKFNNCQSIRITNVTPKNLTSQFRREIEVV